MERKTAADFDQELLILFDAYVHGDIDRRGFLDRAAKFAVGGTTAAMLLEALSPRFAEAQQVAPDDSRLATSWVTYRRGTASSSWSDRGRDRHRGRGGRPWPIGRAGSQGH